MSNIESILQEMGCKTLPQKIRISDNYRDTVWKEYVYNPNLGKYSCITLDEDDGQPTRKRNA